jgi:lactoylglutathione lyase
MPTNARALHYVFRIGNRKASIDFYTKTLGMRVLRHEEFSEGCSATCNGPYDGRWSKTMVGYGDEDEHFVIELTYNYGIGSYELGNDYHGIWIVSKSAADKAKKASKENKDGFAVVTDPDGHNFYVKESSDETLPVKKVSVNVKDLAESTKFWKELCGMKVEESNDEHSILTFGEKQCKLELRQLKGELSRGTAFGRLAFSCPTDQLKEVEAKAKSVNEHYVQTPYVSLDTPGKATVCVVILRDPNDHEICFVGDEAYKELSIIDPKAEELLREAIEKDDSDDWYKQKNRPKPAAQ